MDKGYVQVYTGHGKGKTTAALGLALRAAGSGLKVIIFQFLKGAHSGELDSIPCLQGRVLIVRLGEADKFFSALSKEEKAELKERLHQELAQVRAVLENKTCDILILDEIMAAIHGQMLAVDEVCALIDTRPGCMELVLTGRSVPQEIIDKADLVTEMCCVKHYMDQGVTARIGVEK